MRLPTIVLLSWLLNPLVLLTGCAATHAAGIRRMAEHRLKHCRTAVFDSHCARQSRDYCRANGLEDDCGQGISF